LKEKEREMDYLREARNNLERSNVSNHPHAMLTVIQSVAAALIAVAEKLPEKEKENDNARLRLP